MEKTYPIRITTGRYDRDFLAPPDFQRSCKPQALEVPFFFWNFQTLADYATYTCLHVCWKIGCFEAGAKVLSC